MPPVDLYDDTIRPSTLYPGCFYCPRCQATYTPGLEWGYRARHLRYNDTSGREELYGVRKLGNECPICLRQPGDGAA